MTLSAFDASNPSLDYIQQYKDIAIAEMKRAGIPASIKLAQGLVESGAGKSTLSREANNHFGIKCNGGWEGATFYREDDDYKDGKLIKSCFRKFNSSHESYMAHSDFLTSQKRYRSLFSLAIQDYRSWAKGLKKAGYATDKQYANKLINVIEKYQLYQYDDEGLSSDLIVHADPPRKQAKKKPKTTTTPSAEVIVAGVDYKKKEKTYEANKRRNARSSDRSRRNKQSATSHRVREGESLASIAKDYDLDATILRLRNRIPKNAEPLRGEKLHLRKNISLLKRPKFTRTADSRAIASNDDYLF